MTVSAILELILKQASSKGVRVGEHAAPPHPILLFSGNQLLRALMQFSGQFFLQFDTSINNFFY